MVLAEHVKSFHEIVLSSRTCEQRKKVAVVVQCACYLEIALEEGRWVELRSCVTANSDGELVGSAGPRGNDGGPCSCFSCCCGSW